MNLSLVTGKGGVGKTRFTLLLSEQNKNAALAETALALKIEASKLDVIPSPIFHFTRSDLAEDFLISTVKIKTIAKWLSKSSLFQTLLSLAPNLNELLLLRQWIELSRENQVIVDAPSTGHFIAIFDAIKTAQIVFDGGSLKQIANEIDDFFKTQNNSVYIVSLPEKSALDEMYEIRKYIESQYPRIEVKTVLNRKHEKVASEFNMPDELRAIANERVHFEDNRLAGVKFDYKILEGAKTL